MLKASKIPSFIPNRNYTVDVSLDSLLDVINRYSDRYKLDLDPIFQRGHVWQEKQKVAWIEYILRGGETSTPIYFNVPNWMEKNSGEMVIVDGKQRLTACMEFLTDQFRVFKGIEGKEEGYTCSEIDPSAIWTKRLKFSINNLVSDKDVILWYLQMNRGHIAHTEEELQRVEALIK